MDRDDRPIIEDTEIHLSLEVRDDRPIIEDKERVFFESVSPMTAREPARAIPASPTPQREVGKESAKLQAH